MADIRPVTGVFGPDGARYALPADAVPGFETCNPLTVTVRQVATLDRGTEREVAWREDVTGKGADPRRDDCPRGDPYPMIDETDHLYYSYLDTDWLAAGFTLPTPEEGWQHASVFSVSKRVDLVMSDVKGNDVIKVRLYPLP